MFINKHIGGVKSPPHTQKALSAHMLGLVAALEGESVAGLVAVTGGKKIRGGKDLPGVSLIPIC